MVVAYANKLLVDLKTEVENHKNRELISIYFGGGTPSLLPPKLVKNIIENVKNYFFCSSDMEITLEANPGTINLSRCQEFKNAGINRLSIGVQSFADKNLKNINRIHNAEEVLAAIMAVKQTGFTNFNLDLMYGLPGQNVKNAIDDLRVALDCKSPHISWYQLTLESELLALPYGEELWDIQQAGQELLAEFGLEQYEVSAYCRSIEDRCKHNLNYWQYGDYIGIGAGAHGKLTLSNYESANGHIIKRYAKISHPAKYLESTQLIENEEIITKEKSPLEFMLNALRLYQPIRHELFQNRTGITIDVIAKQLQYAEKLGLIQLQDDAILTTDHGKNFLNDLLEIFS